jgi:hypothetical protein
MFIANDTTVAFCVFVVVIVVVFVVDSIRM